MKYPGYESSKLEFKQKIPKNDKIINSIIAFCNMYGGRLIIGVDDDRNIVGIPEDQAHEAMEWLNESIFNASAPPIIPQIYQQHIDSKYLIVIEVSSGMQKPYYKRSLGMHEGTFVRLGRSTLRADLDIIEELKLQSRGRSFDQCAVYHAQRNDLDESLIQTFLRDRRNGAKVLVADEILKSYDLLLEEHSHMYPTVAGLLLFGNNSQKFLTESYILCSQFSGTKGRDAIASQVCTGTLFEQFERAYDFITSRLNKSFTIKGKRRKEALELPAVAIREVLMNAIMHRNYHLRSPIKIAIYENRVEFFSPGVFPGPIDLNQLDSGVTYTRNVVIAKVLWESRYVEKMGSGFITLFDSCSKAGLIKPDVTEGTNFIKVTIYREHAEEQQNSNKEKIVNIARRFDEVTSADIADMLTLSKSTVNNLLKELVNSGILIRGGKGRSTRYSLNKKK